MQDGASVPLSFFEGGRKHLLMRGGSRSIPVSCPVRIFQGLHDSVVPPSHCRELIEKLATDDVHVTLIKVRLLPFAKTDSNVRHTS